ncbi:hypothetical protein V5799_020826 [Amblyomma americanum]|uniref:Secreted protein n=1 Tax=Amblyomma americanum TaxID=6943 RepID=A0AAQ4ET75_AMBAM
MASTYTLVALLVAAAMTSASASLPTSCTNITISNILNIGNCVGNSTNFCGSTSASGATQGITKITNCVIQGIYQNGSPQGIVSALAPLFLIIANRGIPTGINLGALGNYQLCNSSGCLNFLIKNDSCAGSINIGLPAVGSVGSCAGDTTMMCTAGSPTTTNMVQSTVQSIVCILSQLPADQFRTVVRGIVCQLVTVINTTTQGNTALRLTFGFFSTAITFGLGVTCPLTR